MSPLFTPPSPKAMAFGGVLMMKGIPNDAVIAIRIGVDGSGMRSVASGSIITEAVLLITAAVSGR